jgi:hypothetical protein
MLLRKGAIDEWRSWRDTWLIGRVSRVSEDNWYYVPEAVALQADGLRKARKDDHDPVPRR